MKLGVLVQASEPGSCVSKAAAPRLSPYILLLEGKQRWKQIRIELAVRPANQSEG
jgi:hypothetical protein